MRKCSEASSRQLTSSSKEQFESFLSDERLADTPLWHLNLLAFREHGGEDEYSKSYARSMGGRSGLLSRFGARSTLAAQTKTHNELVKSMEKQVCDCAIMCVHMRVCNVLVSKP